MGSEMCIRDSPWGLRNTKTVATFVGLWGGSGVTSYADQTEALPAQGAATCETVAAFVAPSSLLLCQIAVAFLPIILVARVMP